MVKYIKYIKQNVEDFIIKLKKQKVMFLILITKIKKIEQFL